MQTSSSPFSPHLPARKRLASRSAGPSNSTPVAAIGVAVATVLLLLCWVSPAYSTPLGEVSPYGEVSRFGGFVEGGAPGKFDVPVGFAVDPGDASTADHNAVYVLDRVVYDAEGHLGYRLQKLSSTGVVLGSVTLPPQTYTDIENYSDAHPMFSLAVDSSKHRVYALVQGLVEVPPGKFINVAQSLVAWSTQPNGEKKLLPAEESPGHAYPEDPLTHAALVAGQTVLEPAEPTEDLAVPEGLTIASNHDVVIEAQQGAVSLHGGPTILQRVVTEGAGRGTLGGHWVANETIEPNQEKGTGVFTTASGSFGIDLHSSGEGAISRLAEVKSGLTEASLLAPDQSHGVNRDQATSIDTFPTSNRNGASNAGTQIVYTAGSPITQLTNGLYAARYGHYLAEELDSQAAIAPWNEPMTPAPFWTQASNTGLRLFKEDGSVVTTIGGQPAGHPCNLDTPQLSVAAGAGESLFVLTQPNEAHANSDDQVIEFAPGGAGACPVPSISEVKVTQNGAEEVKGLHGEAIVHAGAPVAFKVSGLNRVGETPFEFDWNVTGATSGGSHNDGFTLVSKIEAANSYKWPSPATEYQYSLEEVGPHEGKVRLIGDFGAITVPFQVDVLGSGNPTAEFTGPGSAAEGQSVAFDGSSSKPTPGSSIVEYRWEFSDDGSQHERESPQESHTFAHAGTYNVKLTIFDAAGHEATVTKEVTVTATACPTSTCGGGGGGGGTVTTTATTSTTPPPPPPPPPVGAVASFGSTVTGGAVAVDVSCPAGNVSCSGTVQLRSIGALAAKKRKSKAPVILGQASFSVPGGHSATVRVHLSSKATAALKKAHTLHVTAIITTTVAGRMQTHTVNVTLRAKAVKGKHH